jgi:glycosyltransferase involved in cell wall biosynthesis
MKIVIVVSDPTSGLLQYPVDLALCFQSLGHEVTVLSWTTKGQNPDLYDRIKASPLRYVVEPSLQYSFSPKALLTGLRAKPDSTIEPADLLLTFGPLTAWQIRRYGKRKAVSLAMIAAMGHDRSSWWKPLLGAALLNRYTTHVGALCHLEIGRLTSLGVHAKKIVLVHNWVDQDRLVYQTSRLSSAAEVYAKLALPSNRKLIACLASFQPRKRQDLLINAFARLADQWSGFNLVLAGGGAERASCEQLVQHLGLTERVHFVGQLANDDAMSLLSIADIVVHCSNAETFGYSMVEPLYLQKPTIVTNVGIAWEMEHADVAEVVPPDDLAALEEALSKVMQGGAQIEQRLARSRQFVIDNFEVNKIAQQILSLKVPS